MNSQNRLITLTTLLLCACGVAAGNPDRPTGKLYIDKRYPPAATAGAPLTLEGRNFGTERGTVRIGGQSVNVLSWSKDKVVVETPSSETTACESVRVFSDDGDKSNVVPFAYANQGVWRSNAEVPMARRQPLSVWTGEEFIVWGGDTNTGGRYNPLTDSWLPMSTVGAPVPNPGSLGRGVAFWTGKEMLVWSQNGGGKYDPFEDTWSPITNEGGPNEYRFSAVWTGTELIIWGDNGGARYNPATDRWRAMSETIEGDDEATKTLKRGFHSAVWSGDAMIIWGGFAGGDALTSGARYNPKTERWSTISSKSGLSPRAYHQAVWTGEEMLVFGGTPDDKPMTSPNIETTGVRYNPQTDTWTPMSAMNAPSGGVWATAVWTGQEWVFFGGHASNFDEKPERSGASYDPRTDRWTPLPQLNQPEGRALATAVWTGSDMLLWGGFDEQLANTATGARFNAKTRTWAPIAGVRGEPAPRVGNSVVWTGAELIIWGGMLVGTDYLSAASAAETGGRYDPVANEWRPISRPPSGRMFHEAVWSGSQMLIAPLGENVPGLAYHPETDVWSTLSPVGAPATGWQPAVVWTGDKMIVWGGTFHDSNQAGAGMYDPLIDAWFPMSTTGAPPNRALAHPVWTGKEMLVYGGGDTHLLMENNGFSSGGRYNPATNKWAPMPVAEFLDIGSSNGAVWTGREFVIIGTHARGTVVDPVLDAQGGRYDPETNEWRPLHLTGAPIGAWPEAVWSRKEILVFSQPDDHPLGNSRPITGFRYDLESDRWSPVRCGCNSYNQRMFDRTAANFGALRQKAVWTGSNVQIWGLYGGFTYEP